MKDILQIIGMVLGVIVMIIFDVLGVIMVYSKDEDERSSDELFKSLAFGSAAGMFIIFIFTSIVHIL